MNLLLRLFFILRLFQLLESLSFYALVQLLLLSLVPKQSSLLILDTLDLKLKTRLRWGWGEQFMGGRRRSHRGVSGGGKEKMGLLETNIWEGGMVVRMRKSEGKGEITQMICH